MSEHHSALPDVTIGRLRMTSLDLDTNVRSARIPENGVFGRCKQLVETEDLEINIGTRVEEDVAKGTFVESY